MQEHEKNKWNGTGKKMKSKDSSPEEQTESLKQGHPYIANFYVYCCSTCNFKMFKGKKCKY